jgi:hypothetical protein
MATTPHEPPDHQAARSRAVRGEVRRRHFAEGGDLAGWRGRASVHKDRRKEANRKACRGRGETD